MSDKLKKFYKKLMDFPQQYQHVFTEIYDIDSIEKPQKHVSLENILVSVKDNFDLKGLKTRAGTRIFENAPEADSTAPAIQNLIDAGAYIVGHTNMTELAYSGLGLNPHFNTPENAIMPDHAPGGSSAGAAISVALGLVDIAIGTDTSGSVRIPAAFNRLVGYKPSQNTVSLEQVIPLSSLNDSVGPIAKTVEECALAWQVLAGKKVTPIAAEKGQMHFTIPTNFGMDMLDDCVADAFEKSVEQLLIAGHNVERKLLDVMDGFRNLAIWQFSAYEASLNFAEHINNVPNDFDSRVLARINRRAEFTEAEYEKTKTQRHILAKNYNKNFRNTSILLPTVAILPPSLAELEDGNVFNQKNILALRNAGMANALNGCSISIPNGLKHLPTGLMLTKPAELDDEIFAEALAIQPLLET